jgi:hypothetical protein
MFMHEIYVRYDESQIIGQGDLGAPYLFHRFGEAEDFDRQRSSRN